MIVLVFAVNLFLLCVVIPLCEGHQKCNIELELELDAPN